MCFKISGSVCKRISSIIHKYWWSSKAEERTIHWVKNSTLYNDKTEGSLNFWELELVNDALLAKQFWRIYSAPSTLWWVGFLKLDTLMIQISFVLNLTLALLLPGKVYEMWAGSWKTGWILIMKKGLVGVWRTMACLLLVRLILSWKSFKVVRQRRSPVSVRIRVRSHNSRKQFGGRGFKIKPSSLCEDFSMIPCQSLVIYGEEVFLWICNVRRNLLSMFSWIVGGLSHFWPGLGICLSWDFSKFDKIG